MAAARIAAFPAPPRSNGLGPRPDAGPRAPGRRRGGLGLQRIAFISERQSAGALCFSSRFTLPGIHALPRSALALCLLAWAPALRAQEPPRAPPAPPAQGEGIAPDSVVRLLGREVKDKTGEVVAQIVNLLVDAAGEPRAVILDYGGFLGVGKRRIAVAWRALRFAPGAGTGAVTLELDREQLKNFPEYKPDVPILAAVPPPEAAAPPAAGAPRQAPE